MSGRDADFPALSTGRRCGCHLSATWRFAPPDAASHVYFALPLIAIITILLYGCGTTALKPEPKLVSSVTSLPPVQVPIAVRCVKEVPPMPKVTIDPNSTVLQRYYAMRELIAAQDEYAIRANAALTACAAEPSK